MVERADLGAGDPGIRRAVFLLVVLGVVGSSPRAIIRYAEEAPYHSGSWWRNTRDALDVSREVFGLMNVSAGFPVQPDRQGR